MHLDRHRQKHSIVKSGLLCPFPGCAQNFSRPDNLQRHVSKTHSRPDQPPEMPTIPAKEVAASGGFLQGTPLLRAIESRDRAALSSLIRWGANFAEVDLKANDALHVAVEVRDIALLKIVLKHINCTKLRQNVDGNTALHRAASSGQLCMVKLLAAQEGHDDVNNEGHNALYVAALKGHAHVVEYLLGQGAEFDRPSKRNWTALYTAAEKGHTEVVGLLLRRGANPRRRFLHYTYLTRVHRELLACAVRSRSVACCQAIVDFDQSQEVRGRISAYCALEIAVGYGDLAMISLLVDQFKLEFPEDSRAHRLGQITSRAAEDDQAGAIELLLREGAALDQWYAGTAIHYAAHLGASKQDWNLFKLVVKASSNVCGSKAHEGIELAQAHGTPEIIEFATRKVQTPGFVNLNHY